LGGCENDVHSYKSFSPINFRVGIEFAPAVFCWRQNFTLCGGAVGQRNDCRGLDQENGRRILFDYDHRLHGRVIGVVEATDVLDHRRYNLPW